MPSDNLKNTCAICSETFGSITKRKAHVKDIHWPACRLCSEKFPTKKQMTQHFRQCSPQKLSRPRHAAPAVEAAPVVKNVRDVENSPAPPAVATGTNVCDTTAKMEVVSSPVVTIPISGPDNAIVEPAALVNIASAGEKKPTQIYDDFICTQRICDALRFDKERDLNVHRALFHGIINAGNENHFMLQDWRDWHDFLANPRAKCIACQEQFSTNSELKKHVCPFGVGTSG
ncbi:hypothetical protein FA95DRAFT_1601171 [Auriscalpium vulgare]|uniref:Uncharacterized protein n=1 Tax=Auriscalpium vulgare TaxID=40419 RepID=A0ACB8SAH2_9AGAM|nr:hypothetical protein FA95DRAFT_1601171 [Auriscalpium vulgare]